MDYTFVKLLPLVGMMWLLRAKVVTTAEIGLRLPRAGEFIIVTSSVFLIGILLDQNVPPILKRVLGGGHLGAMPEIQDNFWNWFDLTGGLFIVGICEELVFRGLACLVLSCWTSSSTVIVYVSAMAFGLIHWSNGVFAVLSTGLIGAVFMIFYLRTRSLPALIVAHFLIDFVVFAGVVPGSWFRLFG